MRRIYPDVADEALDELYTDLRFPPAPESRPHVYLDVVASVDGAATVHGGTGELGGEADRLAFSRLREWCDAILVGATTVRIENYGPPRPRDDAQRRRRERGLAPVPRLLVVTATCALNPGGRLFSDPDRRPTILTPEDADHARLQALRSVADLLSVGRGRVDLQVALQQLRAQGVSRLLCEGGPSLNGQLVALGLVDELFVTVSPQLVGASAHRIVDWELAPTPRPLRLVELREHRGELLGRYRIA